MKGQAEVRRASQEGNSEVPALHHHMLQDKIRLDCGPCATFQLIICICLEQSRIAEIGKKIKWPVRGLR